MIEIPTPFLPVLKLPGGFCAEHTQWEPFRMRLACCVRSFTLSFCSHKTPWTWEKTNYSFTHRSPSAFSSLRRPPGNITVFHRAGYDTGVVTLGGPWLIFWTGWPALFGACPPEHEALKHRAPSPAALLTLLLPSVSKPDQTRLPKASSMQTDSLMLIKWSVQVHAGTYRGCAWPRFTMFMHYLLWNIWWCQRTLGQSVRCVYVSRVQRGFRRNKPIQCERQREKEVAVIYW